ncbi:NAD(P)/FAD-dependent oxidoreductase [Oceanobacillus jeddahense]|uniref:NAD(P)/FAD-dependent oxidoreductase n=1 Tax=Oceanobacillus jeddahense TaxID=1462527 RepID=UPI0005958E3C|nr:FAD-dependent oxidoreductase [Oceanobacillus jeddahense]
MRKPYIIIGGGILGASTAFYLTQQGAEVILIDRDDEGQATDAAAGIICPWISQRRNKKWYHLAKNGARVYPSLVADLEKLGEKDTGYKQVGALSLHTDSNKLDGMEERAYKRRENAPEIGDISRLTAEETQQRFPILNKDYQAVYISGAARVDGRKLLNSLKNAVRKNGAVLLSGNAKLHVTEDKVTGVVCNGEIIEAGKVILTSGAWMKETTEPLDIQLDVSFQRAQIMHLEILGLETADWPVVMPPGNKYLLSQDDHRFVIGSTHEDQVDFDYRVTAAGIHEILDQGFAIAPDLAEATILETRVGFRPYTPGFLPVIGELPEHSNVLLANGLGSSGLTMGPYLGQQLAKLAFDEKPDINLDHYDVKSAMKLH